MRVAVIYFSRQREGRLPRLAKAYSHGIAKQGHDVALINRFADSSSLFSYDYLVLGAEPGSFFSAKIDVSVQQALKNLGTLPGKPCYAFIAKRGWWSSRSLQLWMKWLESCGLLLLLSDIVAKPSEAQYIGTKLRISN